MSAALLFRPVVEEEAGATQDATLHLFYALFITGEYIKATLFHISNKF